MRVLIVDDEPLARLGLRRLLEPLPGVAIAGECGSGAEAVRAIVAGTPDLVFLDVQMPGGSGFDVIEQVGPDLMPPVVFVTAYDQHAVRAFEVHALDYLLKPIDPDRFRDAFTRASRLLDRASAGPGRRLEQLLRAVEEPGDAAPLSRLAVRDAGRIVFVEAGDIGYIEAAGNYVRLYVGRRAHLVRRTMETLERRLGPAFVRIRRSLLVNARAIAALEPYGKGSYAVVLRDGTRLISSRYYGARLRALLAAST
jgi:two-component system LytT family response regulator